MRDGAEHAEKNESFRVCNVGFVIIICMIYIYIYIPYIITIIMFR